MATQPFDLSGRSALVTGCGSPEGIGFATARLLARLGAAVAITSTTERIHERASELGVTGHVADLSDREQAFGLVDAAGPLDVLVNAAGMVQTGFEQAEASFVDLAPEALAHRIKKSPAS